MRISDWSSDVCSSDLWFGTVLAILGWIDLRRRIIPNRIVVPAIVVALAYALVSPDQPFASAMGGAVLASTPFALLFLVLPPPEIGRASVGERVGKSV